MRSRASPAEPVPGAPVSERPTPHRVRVVRKWTPASEIAAFQLEAIDGSLPAFEPGAHIDLRLPEWTDPAIFLTNAPGDTAAYVIGVKREPDSGGGSLMLAEPRIPSKATCLRSAIRITTFSYSRRQGRRC